MKKQYLLAEKIDDAAAMAFDLVTMGNILFELDKTRDAMDRFEQALKVMKNSSLSDELKANAERGYLFNSARVALKEKDLEKAKSAHKLFMEKVTALQNPAQIRQAHQLAGMIACAGKDYQLAVEEYQQANLQNPYNLFRMAMAFHKKGDSAEAGEWLQRTVNFNALNSLNYSFIRNKAQAMLAKS